MVEHEALDGDGDGDGVKKAGKMYTSGVMNRGFEK